MERGGVVHVGGKEAKGKPTATERTKDPRQRTADGPTSMMRAKEPASTDAGRAQVDEEGEK